MYNVGQKLTTVRALECGRMWVRTQIGSNQRLKTCICCFSAKHAALSRQNKDWLARNQDNMSEWGNMSIRKPLFHSKQQTNSI
jgi:hypothetical protein